MSYTELTGKVAVVTGASQGIGLEISKIFLANGATVVGVDFAHEDGEDKGIDYIKADVSKFEECESVFNRIVEKYGHIDVLVNNAGITRDAMTKKMTEAQFDAVIAVNLKGVWNMTKFIGPFMQSQQGGSIINISSVVGFYGNVGQSNYAATKAGVVGMTKSWAKEFAFKNGNVRVNAIAPGYCMTAMMDTVPEDLLERFKGQTMLGRLGQPDEIAKVALFLASDLSSYVTGTTIHADGGMRL